MLITNISSFSYKTFKRSKIIYMSLRMLRLLYRMQELSILAYGKFFFFKKKYQWQIITYVAIELLFVLVLQEFILSQSYNSFSFYFSLVQSRVRIIKKKKNSNKEDMIFLWFIFVIQDVRGPH